MELEDIKRYVDENVTEADLFQDITNENRILEEIQKKFDARVKKTYELRLDKAGKNPFKRWFYLGLGKDKFHNVDCKFTPFDRHRTNAFYKWRKKAETKGVTIKRPYFSDYNNNEKTFKLYRYTKYYYRNIWKAIKGYLEYTPQTSLYSMDEVVDFLILKLTILGTYHGGGFSHILRKKEQMHTIWKGRQMLLELVGSEKIFEDLKNKSFKNKFHVSWDYLDAITHYNKDKFIETGIVNQDYDSKGLTFGLNPKYVMEVFNATACSTPHGRELLLKKCDEMEEYWHSLDGVNENGQSYLGLFMKIKTRKAFEYISQHYFDWGD